VDRLSTLRQAPSPQPSRGWLAAHKQRLAYVLVAVSMALFVGSVKFTPAGGDVMVKTGDGDGKAVVTVTDSGIGVSTVDQAQLFDAFFRARTTTAQTVQGTGLGLTITKAIVDAHGGSITVESRVGTGTTFRVLLPRTHARAGRKPARANVTSS
jgi:signal transduction histidine kinase